MSDNRSAESSGPALRPNGRPRRYDTHADVGTSTGSDRAARYDPAMTMTTTPTPTSADQTVKLLFSTRVCIGIVIFGLLVSGVTAFPLEHEIRLLAHWLNIPPAASPTEFAGVRHWIATVRQGLEVTNAKYPFIAYGTDWLAFAHLLLGVLMVGPWRDPVRNVWVIDFAIFASVAVFPLALICGPIRGIPFGWTCLDCSFGIVALVPLWICRRNVTLLTRASAGSDTGSNEFPRG